jgi:hypothetical protein
LPPPARPTQALSDYAALPIQSRTCVRYAGSVGTWHDVDLGRPIAAPLDQCAQLLDVDLATVHELAAKVEPYLRADGTRIWSLMSWSVNCAHVCTAGGEAATSTVDERGSSTSSYASVEQNDRYLQELQWLTPLLTNYVGLSSARRRCFSMSMLDRPSSAISS